MAPPALPISRPLRLATPALLPTRLPSSHSSPHTCPFISSACDLAPARPKPAALTRLAGPPSQPSSVRAAAGCQKHRPRTPSHVFSPRPCPRLSRPRGQRVEMPEDTNVASCIDINWQQSRALTHGPSSALGECQQDARGSRFLLSGPTPPLYRSSRLRFY